MVVVSSDRLDEGPSPGGRGRATGVCLSGPCLMRDRFRVPT
ncbi:MAG: hypothetical protein QOH17_4132, partial [Pseudonocardiales bacterium]|nr:hypothetical protein [Pseudonocardiales bacterium]